VSLDEGERWELDELITRYELDESLREAFVEGGDDAELLRQVLRRAGIAIDIYEGDLLDIPYDAFVSTGWEDNVRSRVRFVARELNTRCSVDLINRVVCIIDADFDYLFGSVAAERLLLVTDFTALELYACNSDTLDKFVRIVLRGGSGKSAELLRALEVPLRELFLIRAANQSMSLGLDALPVKAAILVDDGEAAFDETYVAKLLAKNRVRDQEAAFRAAMEKLRKKAPADMRQAIHGHDFVEALRVYAMHVLDAKRVPDLEVFAGSLLATIDADVLGANSMYKEVIRRYSA
jgi:hypothetical protein